MNNERVTQLVEYRAIEGVADEVTLDSRKSKVRVLPRSLTQGVAQLGRARALGARGRRFETCHLDSFFKLFISKETTNASTSKSLTTRKKTRSLITFLFEMTCPKAFRPHKSPMQRVKAALAIYLKALSPLFLLAARLNLNGWSDSLRYQFAQFVKLIRRIMVSLWQLALCRTNVAGFENTSAACPFSDESRCVGRLTMQRGRSLPICHAPVAQLIRALRVMSSDVAGLNPVRRVCNLDLDRSYGACVPVASFLN